MNLGTKFPKTKITRNASRQSIVSRRNDVAAFLNDALKFLITKNPSRWKKGRRILKLYLHQNTGWKTNSTLKSI